ncbi:ankyrin repeat domain-containing protein [Polaribacter sp. R2A056_3_33]|uniref:ankyrin repeat domain-containing protein n=1 Tax=Polaribacter sp. R2A056_3_33 TaxID=2745563 RepID=UPI001C4F4846|nr:ankyrin repeat domain-containing protein [Polaribacter sp. R2A056_3_33]QXP69608.1 ankyrin repeat domain-containing protein [Polaribacter sp. R2A056_3_33]
MKRTKLIALVAILFISTVVVAQRKQQQSSNIFLDRDFWDTNPSIEIIDQKIAQGNNPSEANKGGFDGVVYAILQKAPNASIKYLLSKEGNDVNKITHDKRTYVFWAAYADNLELTAYLIKNGADLSLKDSHQSSPLTFAANAGNTNTKIYDLFIENGLDIATDTNGHGANALLLLLPSLNNLDLLDYFTSKGLALNSTDNDGNGAFNYAAKKGNKEMLNLLIKKGLPYKNLNKNGENALLLATRGGRGGYNSLAFFKYLNSLGLDANVTNKDGRNAFHFLASGNKDIATFNYFLSKNVDINHADKEGNTPLLNATGRNSLEIVTFLTEKTKDINHTNKQGNSALSVAVERNSSDVVAYLINQKANINVTDKDGNTLAYYLLNSYNERRNDNFATKKNLLVKNGLKLNQIQGGNNTLFHFALDNKNIKLLKEVNSYGIDVNAKNNEGYTALHLAAMKSKDTKIINYLLSIGADKNIKNEFEESTYDLALENELLKNTDIKFLK